MDTYEADYIIVGGGTAGCVIAARLLERTNSTVLVIESGGNHMDDPNVKLVKNYTNYWGVPGIPQDTLWSYYVQRNTCNSTMFYPIARMLGGCSGHHAMVNNPGHPETYNIWAKILNNPLWNYNNINRILRYMEHCNDPYANPETHGFDGWLQLSINPLEPIEKTLFDVSLKYYNYIPDWNEPNVSMEGVGILYDQFKYLIPENPDNGVVDIMRRNTAQRSYAAQDLLLPMITRKTNNIQILYDSYVTKLNISNGVVMGVEGVRGKHIFEVDPKLDVFKDERKYLPKFRAIARKEVILCTGSIRTPQLLMLSGIGPRQHLEELGIPVVYDSPLIGYNFSDHIETTVAYKADYTPTLGRPAGNGLEININTGVTNPNPLLPDCRISTINAYIEDFNSQVWSQCIDPKQTYLSFEVQITHPSCSKGTIHLKSTDALDAPIIKQNVSGREGDIDICRLVEGVKVTRTLMNDVSMKQYNPVELYPGPQYDTDDKLYEFIKNFYYAHHLTSTVRMGADNDLSSALDSYMRVRGVSRLRVCDASVFPIITGGNPSLPVYICAEMLSNMLTFDK